MKSIFATAIGSLSLFIALMLASGQSNAQGSSNTEKAGDVLQIALPATAYIATFAMDDPEGRKQFYKSFATNIAVTYAIKYAIDKPRPEGNGGQAFPSGHTSTSFQSATFIHRRYGLKYGIPAYAAATYVGWSRVEGESDKHDFSDVAAGAVVGIISGYYFTTPYNGFTVTPTADSKSIGFVISKEW
ncbi:MAG: phosphatase PAP2 family protein [Xanthomonadales bacterium]|nr:phosphatase PAP2 family protein [Xanthomonadales bacterium]